MRASVVVVMLVAASLLVAASARPTESTLRLAKNSTVTVTKKDLPYGPEIESAFGRAAQYIADGRLGDCKTHKCTVLNGAKSWGASYVEVKPYQTLSIVKSVNKAYKGAVAILKKYAGFAMTSSSWSITGGKIEATGTGAWVSLTKSALSLISSQILGAFNSFFLFQSSLNIDKSQVDIINAIVGLFPGSKLVVRDSGFNINATGASLSYSPSFYAVESQVSFTRGVLVFNNIKEAYFFNSSVTFVDVQIVLINSSITFWGGKFNTTNSVAHLGNSTITFANVTFTGDRYLSATSGFPGLPKVLPKPYKKVGTINFSLSGNGNITLRSAST